MLTLTNEEVNQARLIAMPKDNYNLVRSVPGALILRVAEIFVDKVNKFLALIVPISGGNH